MAKKALGIVGIVDKGEYNPTVTYNKGDFVYYLGSTYLCLLSGIKNITPTNDKTNWKFLARGYEEAGELFLGDDITGLIYKVGIYNGALYIEESLGNIETPIITDTATNKKYTIGIENEKLYIVEVADGS